MAVKPVDQRVLDRYQNDYYVHTDLIYRFGVVLSGSREGAERVTEETFRRLLEDFDKLKSNVNPVDHLMLLAWQAWTSLRQGAYHPWNQPTIASLCKLSVDERAALYVVDMVGFSAVNAAKLMDTSEIDLRLALAEARRKLVDGSISL